MISELVGEILCILLGVLVIALGWTTFGETIVAIGILGLLSWPVRAWHNKRRRARETPSSN